MTFKEQLEAKGLLDAIKYIEYLVKTRTELDENIILHMHLLIFHDTKNDAGQFRTSNVKIGGAFFMPPNYNEILPKILELIDGLKHGILSEDPIDSAILFHHEFVCIHPFIDGNGRIARLLMNYILMKNGYPYIADVKFNDRVKYLDCLQMADLMSVKPLINFIARFVEQSIDRNIYAVENPEKLSLAEASKRCHYSQEYLSLLARKGSISAFKNGRNWYITKEDLDRYVKSIEEKKHKN